MLCTFQASCVVLGISLVTGLLHGHVPVQMFHLPPGDNIKSLNRRAIYQGVARLLGLRGGDEPKRHTTRQTKRAMPGTKQFGFIRVPEPTPQETYGTANQYTAGPLLLDKVLADAMQSHDDRVP